MGAGCGKEQRIMRDQKRWFDVQDERGREEIERGRYARTWIGFPWRPGEQK